MYEYPVTNRTPFVKGFECPNCHQRLHSRYKRPYCAECGQKLDWSGSND
jgi:predicted HNH restriction endonuclease